MLYSPILLLDQCHPNFPPPRPYTSHINLFTTSSPTYLILYVIKLICLEQNNLKLFDKQWFKTLVNSFFCVCSLMENHIGSVDKSQAPGGVNVSKDRMFLAWMRGEEVILKRGGWLNRERGKLLKSWREGGADWNYFNGFAWRHLGVWEQAPPENLNIWNSIVAFW